jgi:Leucine rich repeat/Leucine Rich repeat
MQTEPPKTDAAKSERRWFSLKRDGLLVGFLSCEVLIVASERFRWFGFDQDRIRTTLFGLGAVAAALILLVIPWAVAPLLRGRRRHQFSVRSLLIFVLICAVGSAWVGRRREQMRKDRDVMAAVIKNGGMAYHDYEAMVHHQPPGPAWLRNLLGDDFFCEVVLVNFSGGKVPEAGLVDLKEFPQLWELNLNKSQVTDAELELVEALPQLHELWLNETQISDLGMGHLEALTQLQFLSLQNSKVTDVGLEHLKGLHELQKLFLRNTQVTNVGLEHLKGLYQLQWLGLDGTQITDAGLEHLKGLYQLQSLNLNGTQITDSGLEHLKGLVQLQTLWLYNTHFTEGAIENLQHALPNCRIQGLRRGGGVPKVR